MLGVVNEYRKFRHGAPAALPHSFNPVRQKKALSEDFERACSGYVVINRSFAGEVCLYAAILLPARFRLVGGNRP